MRRGRQWKPAALGTEHTLQGPCSGRQAELIFRTAPFLVVGVKTLAYHWTQAGPVS